MPQRASAWTITVLLLLNIAACGPPKPPVEDMTAWSVEVPNEGTFTIAVTKGESDSLQSAAKAAASQGTGPVTITVDNNAFHGALEEPAPEMRPLHVGGTIKPTATGKGTAVKVLISPQAMTLLRARKAH